MSILSIAGTFEKLKSQNECGICSVREIAEVSEVPKSSVHLAMRRDLYLKSYRPQFVQELATDFERRN